MILDVFTWWLISTLLGALALPIAWRIFGRLEDRGYGFARALGLLLAGYFFWIGATLRVFQPSIGGAVLAVLALLVLSVWIGRSTLRDMLDWLKEHRSTVLIMEILFLFSFLVWGFVRANNPEITGTEKPMELAFLNAILHSDSFPPRDPWLSGYAISYYYFGYILLALLTRLTGVASGVAFNLGNSLWFALVALGTYSLAYNFLARRTPGRVKRVSPLLAPLIVLISGNLGGFLEVLHSKYIFWTTTAEGFLASPVWTWIGLEDLEKPPFLNASWMPERYLWWWRSSRVIRELDLNGLPLGLQSIDEFPFFSFLLADNHPHLLAMPFVLMVIAFAFQVFLQGPRTPLPLGEVKWTHSLRKNLVITLGLVFAITVIILGLKAGAAGLGITAAFISILKGVGSYGLILGGVLLVGAVAGGLLPSSLSKLEFWVGAWLFGALAFLNTWDFPIYFSLLLCVMIWRSRTLPLAVWVKSVLTTSLAFIVAAVLFYLPWYPSFSSQAGGILPHLTHPTRFLHFFIMFAVLFIPLSVWLIMRVMQGRRRLEGKWLFGISLGLPLALLILSWLLAAMIYFVGANVIGMGAILSNLGMDSLRDAARTTITLRLTQSWTAIGLGVMIAAAVVLIRRMWKDSVDDTKPGPFVLMMIAIGALLILGPEFFYLKDQFGLRMNTIFKFYFAAWIFWGLAAAYVMDVIWSKRSAKMIPIQILTILPLLAGLIYPALSVWTKTNGLNPVHGRTLNGALHPAYATEADRDAIQWMSDNLDIGVVAEAVGGSYSYFARVSVHTGFPTVIGWPGHEGQWRGGYQFHGTREEDIRALYKSPDWVQTQEILKAYNVKYVYIGELERMTYNPIFDGKFDAFMELVYENDRVKIYARRAGDSP
ncbi:MAG: DUF2298 domain-containing protein [Anaerolineales bacterium]|nr:DUF2298 domain-containing protein [Anaerolineales bacterium]